MILISLIFQHWWSPLKKWLNLFLKPTIFNVKTMVETKSVWDFKKTWLFSKTEQIWKKKFAFTYELKYNYYLFLYSERWYQRSCALVRHEQHQQFSRSFKQPPSPLYVYGFLHSFFKSFLIQCSRIWSKTPKNLGFGTRIDHFHNHFGIRIIDFFSSVKQASPRKLLCYIQRWRWPFWAGSLVMFLLHHRWRFQRLAAGR